MRPSALFPALCALAALILGLLCLFAGSSKPFLQKGDLFTLNTSRIGQTDLFNTSDGDGGLLSDLGNAIEGELNDLLNNATEDIATAIGIHDFYKVHLMTFCEGDYKGDPTSKHPGENITFCSKRNAMYHFDINNTLSSELLDGVSLEDLHFPKAIQNSLNMLKIAFRATFIFYCIAIAFAGIAFLTSLFGVFGGGRLSALGNFVIFGLAFLSMAIASIISTVIIVKFVHTVNKYGKDIGVSATKGKTFLGLTWAATGVLVLGTVGWIFECIIGRRRQRYYGEKA